MTLNLNKALALTLSLATSLTLSSLTWGVNPHDQYYADDLFTAIEEAKKRPHHYDYSQAKRYNRSTTQSLDIPRLLNQEMGTASIDSRNATSITAADTPVGKPQQQYEIADDKVVINHSLPLNTAAPTNANSNVQANNVTTNVIAH